MDNTFGWIVSVYRSRLEFGYKAALTLSLVGVIVHIPAIVLMVLGGYHLINVNWTLLSVVYLGSVVAVCLGILILPTYRRRIQL